MIGDTGWTGAQTQKNTLISPISTTGISTMQDKFFHCLSIWGKQVWAHRGKMGLFGSNYIHEIPSASECMNLS